MTAQKYTFKVNQHRNIETLGGRTGIVYRYIQVSPVFTKPFHVPGLKYQVIIKSKAYKRNMYI